MIGQVVRSLRFFTATGWKFSNQNSLDLSGLFSRLSQLLVYT